MKSLLETNYVQVSFSDTAHHHQQGLSHPFFGMGPGPVVLEKLAVFLLKLGKSIWSIYMKFPLLN